VDNNYGRVGYVDNSYESAEFLIAEAEVCIRFAPKAWLYVRVVLSVVMVDAVCGRILNLNFGCV
jgi:hypothetical protein